MATLEDLNQPSITDMGTDEAIELLRQVRLSRRIPVKSATKSKKAVKTKPKIDANLASELLKILTGS